VPRNFPHAVITWKRHRPEGIFFFFWWHWDLNLRPISWATPSALFFVLGFFEIGSRELYCPGWLPAMILLISASWVARFIGMSHRHPAEKKDFWRCRRQRPQFLILQRWTQWGNVLCSSAPIPRYNDDHFFSTLFSMLCNRKGSEHSFTISGSLFHFWLNLPVCEGLC
jgi:hypothetical protein